MASTKSVSVDLPDDLYRRIRDVAERNERSVESVLRESLEAMFGGAEPESILAELDGFRDDQLWAVVYQRLVWPENERLRDLIARGKQGSLTQAEHTELNTLLDRADRYTLLRSHALRLLKQRGHDVDQFLAMGA